MGLLFAPVLAPGLGGQAPPTLATTVPLVLPGGLAYDGSGNLFFAETAGHVVRRVSPQGALVTVAGSGTQGFSGDGGPATTAQLDSPSAVALDRAGNLFIADSHNHRIRLVDAATGTISTFAGTSVPGLSPDGTSAISAQLDLPSALAFDAAGNLYFADRGTHVVRKIEHSSRSITTAAGNGRQGMSGDGGVATSASIDSPSGIAFDAKGNLYLADTHSHRVRRVDGSTGVISTLAGVGQPGFSGDSGAAAYAALDLPRGLAVDSSGNLFIVDSGNQRVRRIDAASGLISTIAGQGTQTFAGDENLATAASLSVPGAITVSAGGLPTLADAGNGRIRQVDSGAIIHTLAGLGDTSSATLTLAGQAVTLYGTGTILATLVSSAAGGPVTFLEELAGSTDTLGSEPLQRNMATFDTSVLSAGVHRVVATYSGDAAHSSARSDAISLTVTRAGVSAVPNSVSLLYGQTVPLFQGTLTGVLPQDAGKVSLNLSSAARQLSAPGAYAVVATLDGPAAGNYSLTASPAVVTVLQAPAGVTLSNTLAVHVASTTAGAPGGTVKLLDGSIPYASAGVSPSGDAQFSMANLSVGTHILTALYSGDNDFLPASSNPEIATIGPAAAADFTLAASGQTALAVPAGTSASFSFATSAINGGLSSPIQLTVSGLPAGAVGSFNPAYLPPGGTPNAFILTVQTPKVAGLESHGLLTYAWLLPVAMLCLRRRRCHLPAMTALSVLCLGCGDRIYSNPITAGSSAAYNLVVTGSGTSATGATVQHSAGVTLTVQR